MDNKKCIITLSSQTYAMKALGILSENSVKSKLISVNPAKTKKGCSWGIELNCNIFIKAKALLKSKKITFGELK